MAQLAQVREFLTDVHPQRVTVDFQRASEVGVARRLQDTWQQIRAPMQELAIGLPSTRARDLADEICVGLHNVLNQVLWIVRDMSQIAKSRNRGKPN